MEPGSPPKVIMNHHSQSVNNFLLFQLSAPPDVPTPMVTAPGQESASEYPRFSCPVTELEQGGGGAGSSYIKTKNFAPVSFGLSVTNCSLSPARRYQWENHI